MAMRVGNFEFGNMIIYDIRSVHTDTDYVTICVTVGDGDPITKTMAMGDLSPGNYPVDLALQVDLPDTPTAVAFAYAVVNNGHASESLVQQGVEAALTALVKKGAAILAKDISQPIGESIGASLGAAIGTAVVPLIGTAIGALAGYLVSFVSGIVFADCDGTVAAGVRLYTSTQIIGETTSGSDTIVDSVNHPGTDSNWGCGSNSEYLCNTTITSLPPIVPVFDINGHYEAGGKLGPIVTTSGNSIAIDMSSYGRPNATGTILSPTTAQLVFTDDKTVPNGTYTVQIDAPSTIYFVQNKSSWSKASGITTPVAIRFPVFHRKA
jgi:hypothetical protein